MKLLAPIKNDEDIVNKKYVDSIDIGSRNIVTGTDTMTIGSINQATWKNRQWRQSGTGTIETIDITETIVPSVNKGVKFTASTAGKQIGICQDLIPLNNNNIYTLSCWVRGSSSGLTCRLQPFYASSTDTGGVKNFTLTGEWQYISYTTNKTPQNTTNYSGAYIYLIPTAAGDALEVCGIKLERGDKATDWTPAPEDTDTKVTSKTENPESTFTYYPTWVTGATTGEVLVNDGIRYATLQGTTDTNGYGILTLGNDIISETEGNKYGVIRLYSTDAYFGQIAQIAGLTTSVTHALPTTGGTILNTGTTSFTQSLTSGTAVGTLKINGTNITLYAPTNTDTKVTSVENHYSPSADSSAALSASASGATAAWSIDVVKGITLQRDVKGHVTGVSVTSGKIPANPNTDTKVTQIITTSNATYPLLLAPKGQTATATTKAYFDSGVTLNPSTNTIAANISGSSASCTGNAATATKLATSAGSTTQPVYFKDGKPVECTYTLDKSVPSDAAFTDTKVKSVYTNISSTYYPTWVTGAVTDSVSINDGIRYATGEGTDSKDGYGALILGNDISSGTDGNKYGAIELYGSGSCYGRISQMDGTSNVSHSLPATGGTILNTGTTSFTPSLTSGTAIGTLKINNISTILYAPDNTAGSTNTSSKIFLIGATSQASSSTTYSHKNVYANSDNGLYLDNDSKVNSYFVSKQKYTDSITHQINFGISSNGTRGIYDTNAKKWLIYATPSDKDTEPNKVISYGAIEVVTGTLRGDPGTTSPIKRPYGRNRVIIEGWIDGYSGSSYQGLADSMTAVSERTIVKANSKTMTYSISTDGTITISGYGQYRLIYHTL